MPPPPIYKISLLSEILYTNKEVTIMACGKGKKKGGKKGGKK